MALPELIANISPSLYIASVSLVKIGIDTLEATKSELIISRMLFEAEIYLTAPKR